MLFIIILFFFLISPPPPRSTLFPYTTLFRSISEMPYEKGGGVEDPRLVKFGNTFYLTYTGYNNVDGIGADKKDRKSTRLNSSHVSISYAVFCLKKKKKKKKIK